MKPILLGESNPHEGAEPLSAHVKNGSGRRLWQLIADRSYITEDLFNSTFDRRNLCRTNWTDREASDTALRISSLRGRTVVVLGSKVRLKLPGVQDVPLHPQVIDGVEYRCIAHPSGRCRVYNDELYCQMVGILLEDLVLRSQKKR